jgi:hypothetical protein
MLESKGLRNHSPRHKQEIIRQQRGTGEVLQLDGGIRQGKSNCGSGPSASA